MKNTCVGLEMPGEPVRSAFEYKGAMIHIGEHVLGPFNDVEFLLGADGLEEFLRVLNQTALVLIPVN